MGADIFRLALVSETIESYPIFPNSRKDLMTMLIELHMIRTMPLPT